MKKIIHRFFGHTWKSNNKKGWDLSEPKPPIFGSGGDWLPTKWREYICDCGFKKRIYTDGFTHFGDTDDRIFIYDTPYPDWKHLLIINS